MNLQKNCNVLFIYVLCFVLFAAYVYQYSKHENPCPLCLLQRLGMLGVASSLLLNLRFGIKPQHYGLAILSAAAGRIVSLRQIGMHICPEFGTFGEPVLGLDLYVWAWIVFSCSIVACAILLILYGFTKKKESTPTWGRVEMGAFGTVAFLAGANVLTTLIECGISSC